VGTVFDRLEPELAERLTTLNDRLARGESRWMRRLARPTKICRRRTPS
jgi:hypothetical protein